MDPLTDDEKRLLPRLAREALVAFLDRGETPAPPALPPALERPRAAFVTLRRRDTGELRGCRGETRARRPLAESVIRQAIASATDDPRFEPVTLAEVPSLLIRVSALSPLRRIRPDDVVLGRHGLLILSGRRSGLLLPQVAGYHGMTDREEFLRAVCRKAGLPGDAWSDARAALFAFEAEDCGEAETFA